MSGYGETDDARKDKEGTTPTPDHGEKVKETNTGNRRVNEICRRVEQVKLHTEKGYFKGDKPEVGAVLGLLSKKLDIETNFDKFREKLKGYVEINLDNEKDVLCVVTCMEHPMKTFEENKTPSYLYE